MDELTQHTLLQLVNITGKRTTVLVAELIVEALSNMSQEVQAAAQAGQKKEDFSVDRLRRILEQYEPVEGPPVVTKLPKLVSDGWSLLGQSETRQIASQMAWSLTEEFLRRGFYPPHSANWAITRRSGQIDAVLG